MAEVERPWTDDQVKSEAVSKKQIIEFLQEKASSEFITKRKLNGKSVNVAKTATKDSVVAAYNDLFETKAFRNEEQEAALAKLKEEEEKKSEKKDAKQEVKPQEKVQEKPRYTKSVTKKGTGNNTPKKGDTVSVRYKGTLTNGTVFDQNMEKVKGKEISALKFKVGTGKVIRGWDEALLTMVVGEQAKLTIEPEWAYGKKGLPDAGIAPNSTLIFDVELLSIE